MKKIALLFALACTSIIHSIVPFNSCARCIHRVKHFLPFRQAYQKNHYANNPSSDLKIPKIIHQIWLGNTMPLIFAQMATTWKNHHPDWEYRLWTDADLAEFPFETGDLIFKAKNLGQRADIFRLEILNRYGGLYVDTDFVCLKPHDCFHYSTGFYAGLENSVVGNALIASKPNHPIIRSCLNSLKNLQNFSERNIQNTTGPLFLTRVVRAYLNHSTDNAIIYPCSYFYPLHCDKRMSFWNGQCSFLEFLKTYVKPETHSAHFWATSWQKEGQTMIKTHIEQIR